MESPSKQQRTWKGRPAQGRRDNSWYQRNNASSRRNITGGHPICRGASTIQPLHVVVKGTGYPPLWIPPDGRFAHVTDRLARVVAFYQRDVGRTLLDRVGVRLDSFADSDGKIADLFAPV